MMNQRTAARRRRTNQRSCAAAIALLCVASLPAAAQDAKSKPPTVAAEQRQVQSTQAFAAKMRTLYPATQIDEVIATQTPGVYEVVMGPNVAYIDASGRYWTFGHRYDMVERRDLTQPRLDAAGKIDVTSLPIDAALKTVKGDGHRTLFVFADPNCGYCKQLEKTLTQVSDVTVYTFMLPILSQDSADKAAAVWCGPQREAAWHAWMVDGVVPAQRADCPTPNDRVTAIAKRYRIDATPTMVAADGRKAPGAMPAEDLTAWIDAGSATRVARVTSVKTQVVTP